MKAVTTQKPAQKSSGESGDLVRRYEKIGISAVAGALACTHKSKKAAPAPVERRIKDRELQVSA